jgi:hypothetical protein
MISDIRQSQRSQSGAYQGRGHLFRTERREQVPRRNYAVSPRRFSYASVEKSHRCANCVRYSVFPAKARKLVRPPRLKPSPFLYGLDGLRTGESNDREYETRSRLLPRNISGFDLTFLPRVSVQ